MALLGTEANQLDRLGKELRCPICLSLFKQASSLSCNHTFCTSCILQSIKHNSVCPICKVPTTRREVRAAPQMDSLVSIFISMGNAAGFDIMASQADSASKPTGLKVRGSGKKNALSNITNLDEKSKTKACHRSNSPESEFKGPIQPKKRVQVPQPSSFTKEFELGNDDEDCHVHNSTSMSDSPSPRSKKTFKRRAKLSNAHETDCGPQKIGEDDREPKELNLVAAGLSTETAQQDFSKPIEDKVTKLPSNDTEIVQDTNCTPPRDGSSRWKLDPFFWLRDENSQDIDAIQVTQQTPVTPVLQPDFSDLKDSDDSDQEIVKGCNMDAANSYDSDDFDWTQQPCSPELKCSPTKEILNGISLEDIDTIAVEGSLLENKNGTPAPLEESSDMSHVNGNNTRGLIDTKSPEDTDLGRITSPEKHWLSDLRSPKTPMEVDHLGTSGKRKRKCKVSEGYVVNQLDTTPNESVWTMKTSKTTSSGKKRKICRKEVMTVTHEEKSSAMAAWRETEDYNGNETLSDKCKTRNAIQKTPSYDGIPVTYAASDAKLIHAHSHCGEWYFIF